MDDVFETVKASWLPGQVLPFATRRGIRSRSEGRRRGEAKCEGCGTAKSFLLGNAAAQGGKRQDLTLRNRNSGALGRACGQGLSIDRVGFRAVHCAAALRGRATHFDYRAAMQSSSTFAPNANSFAPKALRAGYGGVNAAL